MENASLLQHLSSRQTFKKVCYFKEIKKKYIFKQRKANVAILLSQHKTKLKSPLMYNLSVFKCFIN